MNGAESLVRTLVAGGIDVCFTNPGTSEMHFVAALDSVDGMRCVLGLFEGVVTAAADGYARMADKPASTLLHLGPGLANGLANLHNARRARTPIVNIVGDHATYHRQHDAPLTSDVEGVARPFSHWILTSPDSRSVARDGAAAIAAALTPPGRIATLILPADTAWNDAPDGPASVPPIPARAAAAPDAIDAAARAIRSGEPAVLFIGDMALRERGLDLAGRIAAKTGVRLLAPTSNKRFERGAGRVAVDRLPYAVDRAVATLADVRHLILAGAAAPVAFFAYPGKPSLIAPPDCAVQTLARPEEDVLGALEALADAVGARGTTPLLQSYEPQSPSGGAITPEGLAAMVAALLPEHAIVVDESVSVGRVFFPPTRGARPHDWLHITGGAIGIGLPLAAGAAIACPDRKVVVLQADGSAMYTVQALWTQAREGLDVTTVILNNRAYETLRGELANVGAKNAGRKALDMIDLDRPTLDWLSIARGMGVEAGRAETLDELRRQLAAGLRSPGPYLIDAQLA